jgi:glycosyltransferase involved in cell wall biosynthesis
MKISIITIVFNGEGTIAKAIESVLCQQDVEIEYIVIDGCSQDKTLEAIAPYQKQLTHLISEKDEGIYDAMNKGIKLASGDVVGILNADDFYANPKVLSLVMHQFSDSRVDAVYGDLVYFRPENPDKIVRSYRSHQFHPAKLSRGLIPAHPTLFLRKKVYERFGLFNSSYKIAGDFEFMIRIFKAEIINAKYLPMVMVRMQMGGISTGGLRNTLLLLKENRRACRENGISTSYLRLLSRYPRKLFEYIS